MDGSPPNLNPARRPSLVGCSRIVVAGAGISTLSSSIVCSGKVPGLGKNTERFREWMRLCVWRLLVPGCPEDNDLCMSGAETDCGKANVFNEGESGGGGNMDCRGENELDKGDRSGGEKSLEFVDRDFVLE